MRDSFVFYRSFAEAIKKLKSDEDRLAIYEAVIDYALDDNERDLNDVPAMAFTLIKPQIDANNKRYINGKKGAEYGKLGGRPKKENPEETPKKPQENPTKTPNENVNENENVNVNVKDNIGRFKPPALDEVIAYFNEKGITDRKEAEKFIDFYSCKGWMVGKNKMKDWKAAVRNWIKGMQKPQGKVNNFNNFQSQRDYDYGQLEKILLANG